MKVLTMLFSLLLCYGPVSVAKVLVFTGGAEMEIADYQLKARLIVFTTMEGRVRSVPASLVDLGATERSNRSASPPVAQAAPPERSAAAELTHDVTPRQPPAAREPSRSDAASSSKPRAQGPTTGQSVALARELLDSCGATLLVGQIPQLVDSELARVDDLGPGTLRTDVLREVFEDTLAAESAPGLLSTHLGPALADPEVRGTLSWLRSPLCRRMEQLERSATSDEGRHLLGIYADGLGSHMPSATRLEVLQRLDEALALTDIQIEERLRVFHAALEARNHLASAESRLTPAEIDQAIQETRAELRLSMRNLSLVPLLFTYRTLAESELEAYVRHWETPAGQRLSSALRQAVSVAVERAAETATLRLGRQVTAAPQRGQGSRAAHEPLN